MKIITIKLDDKDQEVIKMSASNQMKIFDKMIAMLLKQGQTEAVKPILKQVEVLKKIQDKVEGVKENSDE